MANKTVRFPTHLLTPECRANWVSVFKPKPNTKGTPKYQLDLIFNPAQMATPEFQALKAAVQQVATQHFGSDLEGLIAAEKFGNPFQKNSKKLDIKTRTLPPGYEEGGCYITPKSTDRPGVKLLTPHGPQDLLDERDIYSGCWVRASLDIYSYQNEGSGVTFGLRNVLVVPSNGRPDEPLGSGGRAKAEQDFAGIAAPAASATGGTASADSLF